MRKHGVPDYPEPEVINGAISISFTGRINPTTPAVRTAAEKCGDQSELWTGPRVAYASCMRTHGVRNFPYPTANGHVSVAMVRAQGINPAAPAVARVEAQCLPVWLRPPTS